MKIFEEQLNGWHRVLVSALRTGFEVLSFQVRLQFPLRSACATRKCHSPRLESDKWNTQFPRPPRTATIVGTTI